ncbi:MAG TPA: Txe/YoeB family addiction module toxin [Streptomyces sp.]
MREVHFDPDGWEDFASWSVDRKAFRWLVRMVGEIQQTPLEGIGKPEPLKGDLSGYWSRRIDDDHRLVYRADGEMVRILKARYHYGC